MKFRHPPKVDRNGSREFIEWQTHQQQLYKQMKLRCPPRIDRHGSHEFVEWQQKQQQLYKEMNGIAEKKSLKPKIAYVEPTWKVDKHGSHGFVEMLKQQQQKHKQMKLKNPPKIDRNGSHDFVEWQQKQQQLYKEMNEVAERKMRLKNPPKVDQHGSHEFIEWQQEQNQLYKETHVAVAQQGPQQQMNGSADPDQQRMMRLQAQADKEVEEHKRRLAEQKRKANEPPPPPKTITVMAGSKNRPAWPIAPGIANANQPRQITLVSGEDELEWEKNRLNVAEAAGLKHVDITVGEQADIYGQGYNESAWSGSLRPTGHKMSKGGNRGQDQNDGKSPWAGSLRHVNPNAQKKKKQKKEDEDDMYGNAPWMGTLRHVKNVNPVFQSIPFKSKKYPDEDAPNPYESMQGRNAKPVYPLTPAAVIPAGGSSAEASKMRAQNAEVERITSGLRETRSLSGTLLKALMPKLLKEHESKYEPLGHDETFHIMEEILSMQMGIDDDSRVGDEENDEAEAMIRAITHGEIDQKVYGQMADDLEKAAKLKLKGGKPKKKKKKKNANSTSSVSGSELATSASEVSVK